MNNPFELDIEAIKAEAQQDAFLHDDINVCCRYPFATMAGSVYKTAFFEAKAAERAAMAQGSAAA